MVPPQRFEQDFLQELQLVGHPPLAVGVLHRGLRGPGRGHLAVGGHSRTLKALVEQ